MPVMATTDTLAKLLEDEGYTVPESCVAVRLVAADNSVLMLQFDCVVPVNDLVKIAGALIALKEQNNG